jgi:hypothetical protein
MAMKWMTKDDCDFLYPRCRFVGSILTANPIAVFLSFSLLCSAMLFIPAQVLGLNSLWIDPQTIPGLPCNDWHTDLSTLGPTHVGILYKLNWSLAYSIFIPLIFGLAAAACRSIRRSLIELVDDGTVQPDTPTPLPDANHFVSAIREKLLFWDRKMHYASLFLATTASVFAANVFNETGNLFVYWKVFRAGQGELKSWYAPCLWDDMDWMHGWTIPGHQGSWLHMLGNFSFYLFAEALQGFVIFIACSFVLKFLVLT